MIRKIVKIHKEKCNGCGACASACHEGAIAMINGKATLIRDDYCDGLGNCLPACPTGAIEIIEREALPFDESVLKNPQNKIKTDWAANNKNFTSLENGEPSAELETCQPSADFEAGEMSADFPDNKQISDIESKKSPKKANGSDFCGCPGSRAAKIERSVTPEDNVNQSRAESFETMLSQWPVQIRLVPVNAPYFDGAHLLVAADCTAYAYGNFHGKFMKNRITLIGCPKLDDVDYSEKLCEIIRQNNIKSVTCVRMSVPCCGGIENAVKQALQKSGKFIPWRVVIIGTDGNITEG